MAPTTSGPSSVARLGICLEKLRNSTWSRLFSFCSRHKMAHAPGEIILAPGEGAGLLKLLLIASRRANMRFHEKTEQRNNLRTALNRQPKSGWVFTNEVEYTRSVYYYICVYAGRRVHENICMKHFDDHVTRHILRTSTHRPNP